jgi:hypothetical protein
MTAAQRPTATSKITKNGLSLTPASAVSGERGKLVRVTA